MNDKGFRIKQIKTEGFKGFTTIKTVPTNGKHIFILGPNGYGKSSIVEGIRWGLFGSTRRPGEVVSNQGYAGSCRVELLLERGDGEWTLKRTLIRGVSGGSDADIVDKHGQSHPLREVLPQLESTPAGEGMHIIYTAQSVPFRRPAEDVSPFERTIYYYLGLTDVRVAILRFEHFIEIQENKEKELAEKVDTERNNIDSELNQLTEQRRRIIENRPWGGGSVPTQAETTTRIEEFIKELSVIVPPESVPPMGMEVDSLITEVETLFEIASRTKTDEVEVALRKTEEQLRQGQALSVELYNITRQFEQLEGESTTIEQNIERALAGKTIDTLTKTVETIEQQVEETALLHDLQKKAFAWFERRPEDLEREYCPVCEQESQARELRDSLSKRIEQASSRELETIAERDALRHQREEVLRQVESLNVLHERRTALQQELEQVTGKILELLSPDSKIQDTTAALKKHMAELDSTKTMQEKRLHEAAELQEEWRRKLNRLQEEARFCRIQERILEFQKQQQRLKFVEDELQAFTLFGDSVRRITDAMKTALNNTLKSDLPVINNKLTEAFVILTEHPAYNRVFIDESILPKLELRVASDDALLPGWQPSQVLNGQALSALELVPYFTFSELTDMPFEVYLLLLDDPTQSFDVHHIDILVSKLAQLGKQVQLVVASHEVEHFQSMLPKYFSPDEYEVLLVTGFSRQDGPILEMVYSGE